MARLHHGLSSFSSLIRGKLRLSVETDGETGRKTRQSEDSHQNYQASIVCPQDYKRIHMKAPRDTPRVTPKSTKTNPRVARPFSRKPCFLGQGGLGEFEFLGQGG